MLMFVTGHIGIVKDCTDDTARVELHTNCRTISVDKNRLSSLKYAQYYILSQPVDYNPGPS